MTDRKEEFKRRIRCNYCMSVKMFVKRAGISYATLSGIINQQLIPQMKTIEKVALLLNPKDREWMLGYIRNGGRV